MDTNEEKNASENKSSLKKFTEETNADKQNLQQQSDVGPNSSAKSNKIEKNRPFRRPGQRRKMDNLLDNPIALEDPYEVAEKSMALIKLGTALYYSNEVMNSHYCTYDPLYPECPDRCETVSYTEKADNDLINLCHVDSLDKLTKISVENEENREKIASTFDSVYFNENTASAASCCVSAVVDMTSKIANGTYKNGFALVRPPGHHADSKEYNGYCFFNNVAIAAKYCLKEKLASKILIVDIDVHHGQGTQRFFYESKEVMYFSIHRYEHGSFWPNLRESNFDYIGEGDGIGYNINVPLNSTGLNDNDYLTIINHILLPVAYKFSPDLIIVSAGYDAAIGCPEFCPDLIVVSAGYDTCLGDDKGQMNITPGFYAHLISSLQGLANGKISVALEGGYFLDSLASGVYMTIKSLLGDSCPLLDLTTPVHPTVIDSINNVKTCLAPYWGCFKTFSVIPEGIINENQFHTVNIRYDGEPNNPPYPTRSFYAEVPEKLRHNKALQVEQLNNYYQTLSSVDSVAWYFDPKMLSHKPSNSSTQIPETPERLLKILEVLQNTHIASRLLKVPAVDESVVRKYISMVHSADYLDNIQEGKFPQRSDLYTNSSTVDAIVTAVCGILSVADCVMKNDAKCGFATVRPPGHHCSKDEPSGFCLVNNVAVCAKYLLNELNIKKILIVDFDIHHGDGTQELFYETDNVLYISTHRYDKGKFFPKKTASDFTAKGVGSGEGYNINIPFNELSGDAEFLAAFQKIVLPIAYSYNPEVVIVSAGFDAGINDPLGHYRVTPEMFAHLITMLKPLGQGRLILSLEGGYNYTTTAWGVAMCFKALLGDPIPSLRKPLYALSNECVRTLQEVINYFKPYWPVLNTYKYITPSNQTKPQ